MNKIGLIGTGLMGKPMARKINEAGYELAVYNRTKEKAADLENDGIKVVDTIKDVFDKSDTVVIMLSDYNAIVSVLFDDYVTFEEKTVIQMSTISPKESLLLKERIDKLGGHYFEAPVLGSIPQIKNKELITLVGGEEKDFESNKKLFEAFSGKIVFVGETGKAAAMKLALNQMIASQTAVFSMSLGYLREKEVDTEKFMDVLRGSALYAPAFDKKLDKYINRDFDDPHFPLKHLLKDVKLMINDFGDEGIDTKTLTAVSELIKEGLDAKLSEKDYSALYNVVHPNKEK